MELDNRTVVFDAQSVRFEEWNGHLRVNNTNLTKANVCEYWGWEIDGDGKLGFQKDKKYKLLRSPDALKAAVQSFAERPIQYVHKAADADKLDNAKVIGATGSNPSFEFPYIKDAITIWDGDYIKRIKNGEQAELSASYAFTPVIEAGEFEGQPYDAIMTDIHVDHIALVEQGRAGPDVRVADSKIKQIHFKGKEMAKLNAVGKRLFTDIVSLINSGRANDSNAKDIASVISKATKTKKEMMPQVVSSLLIGYSMANDEDSDRIEETVKKAMDEDTDCKAKDSGDPVDTLEANDEEDKDKPKVGDEDEDKSKADDEDDKEKKERKIDEQDEKDAKQLNGNIKKLAEENEKRASDAALIEEKITKRLQDTADAREHVKPLVGVYGRASDGAENIYVGALKESGTHVEKGAPISVYKAMVNLAIEAKNSRQQSRASDSSPPSVGEKQRFGATRLRSI